jgi:hypothetical protein
MTSPPNDAMSIALFKRNVSDHIGQGNRIWDAPPSALPGANLLKRVPNISK